MFLIGQEKTRKTRTVGPLFIQAAAYVKFKYKIKNNFIPDVGSPLFGTPKNEFVFFLFLFITINNVYFVDY